VFLKKNYTTYNVTKCLLDHNSNYDYKDTQFDIKMNGQMLYLLR